jgi:hypothetical protein
LPPSAEPGGREPLFSGRRGTQRALSARTGAPHLVPILLVAVAGFLAWRHWDRIVAVDLPVAAASAETQVKDALAHQGRAQLADVYGFRAGGTAELHGVRFLEPSVAVEGARARVVARVEAEGRVTWRDERAELAYLGRESFGMGRCTIALWCGDGEQFALLKSVLLALFRREDAFHARDPEAYARLVSDRYAGPGGKDALLARLREDLPHGPAARVRIQAWQIRVERDRAEVGEDYAIELAGRPPAALRARYVLAREGERWRFVDGL